MKTVSGKIVSTKPISLSRAANTLSNFVKSDNGASQSVSAYLRRASAAFNELVHFKKQHKLKKHVEDSTKSDVNPKKPEENMIGVVVNSHKNRKFEANPVEIDEEGTRKEEDNPRKRENKKKKKTESSLGSEKNDDIEVEAEEDGTRVKENSVAKKKKKKKRKSGEVDGGEAGDSEVSEKKKKKKRRRIEADD